MVKDSELAEKVDEFTYFASHNLAEPIRKIKSYCGILRKKLAGSQDAEIDELFKVIEDAGTRMEVILAKTLEFVQIDTNPETHSPVDLSPCLKQAVSSLKLELDHAQAVLSFEKLPQVIGHEENLQFMFVQILKNCIQFRRPNQSLKIKIESRETDDWHNIRIQDNGIGMDEKGSKTAFTLFAKAHGKTQAPGAGVGLSLCKKIVESVRGSIKLNSDLDKGTIITIKLPKIGSEKQEPPEA